VGLLATLALLLIHAAHYIFLTDDAFISFRYARNLSQGYGLVFNPGLERVEGYSNFLLVLLLAGSDLLRIPPERVPPHLLCFDHRPVGRDRMVRDLKRDGARRKRSSSYRRFFLAASSVAVWSSGGSRHAPSRS
jgi:hypothetical protein